MADITMCQGTGCKVKKTCYRFTAPVNPYRQAYFTNVPQEKEGGCGMYWKVAAKRKTKKKAK